MVKNIKNLSELILIILIVLSLRSFYLVGGGNRGSSPQPFGLLAPFFLEILIALLIPRILGLIIIALISIGSAIFIWLGSVFICLDSCPSAPIYSQYVIVDKLLIIVYILTPLIIIGVNFFRKVKA